jgi:type I restriction enzyme R subunit
MEKEIIEEYLVEKLQEKDWKFVSAKDLKRESYEEPLLLLNLGEAIRKINKHHNLSSQDISKVIDLLRSKFSGVETSKKILSYLKEGVPIKLEKTNELVYIKLIDYENISNNEFIVSRQVYFEGKGLIKVDIVLFVNGIPLVIIECKNPLNRFINWEDGFYQIKRYEKEVEELFKYVQFSVVVVDENEAKYFPNIPWSDELEKANTWRIKGENKTQLDGIIEMLSPNILLDILKNFIFIRDERKRISKVIPRYMQYRAVNEIYKYVINNLNKENKEVKGGTIWHFQGSGKTLTMIYAAYKLYNEKLLENPTIFFIVDRKELEKQLSEEISALDLGIKPLVIESIEQLKQVLTADKGKGMRGWIVVLIHKFREKDLGALRKYLEKFYKEEETILTRKNVIVFVDEAHRTQYGKLADTMRSILRNAFFFAFTGTPVTERERNTFKFFGKPLDIYFMDESIKDGYTLPIHYIPSLERIKVDKEKLNKFLESLEEFLKQDYLEEIPENLDKLPERIKDKIAKRLKLENIKIFLEDEDRIKKIAKDIVEHFRKNVDGKFKAFVVAGSRKACLIYKKYLDEYFGDPKYCEIVMTFERNDLPEFQEYERKLRERYNWKQTEEILKEIQDKFKTEEYPKILIVTNMLLTGFDAPILQTMYLDKPMKGHTLLQALARVNRPLKERGKIFGLIVDYIGILDRIKEAIEFYEYLAKNKYELSNVIANYEVALSLLEAKIEEMKKIIGEIRVRYEEKDLRKYYEYLYKLVSKIVKGNNEKRFLELYKEILNLYEYLGFTQERFKFRDFLIFLEDLYTIFLRSRGTEEREEVRKWYRIVKEEILKNVKTKEIEKSLPPIEITKQAEIVINEIEKEYEDINARVWNLSGIIRNVLIQKPKSETYQDLRANLEKIIEKWKNRKIKIEEVYEEMKKILLSLSSLQEKKSNLNLNDVEFSIFDLLKKKLKDVDEKFLAEKVKELYAEILNEIGDEKSKEWKYRKELGSKIKRVIRLFLIKNFKDKLTLEERDELTSKIFEYL